MYVTVAVPVTDGTNTRASYFWPACSEARQVTVAEATVLLPLADVIDLAAERARLGREQQKAEAEAQKVRQKLDNADFVARAKPEVVEENRDRLAGYEAESLRLAAAVARITG